MTHPTCKIPVQVPGYPSEPPISVSELHNLALQKLPKPRNPKYNEQHKHELTNQLWYHGIRDSWELDHTRVDSLKKFVRDLIKAGKLVENPPRVQEYKESLREREETFRSLSGLEERAEFDANLFVRHYFAPNGKPDRSITPDPLILETFQGRTELTKATRNIPGLESSLVHQGIFEIGVCISWDAAALMRIKTDMEAAYRVEMKKRLWEEVLKKNAELVTEIGKAMNGTKEASENNGDQPGELSRCVGTYTIRCDVISSRYINALPNINIQYSGLTEDILVAAVDWGQVEGTMLLSFSEEELNSYIRSANSREDAYDYTDKGEDEDDKDEDDKDEDDKDEDDKDEDDKDDKDDKDDEDKDDEDKDDEDKDDEDKDDEDKDDEDEDDDGDDEEDWDSGYSTTLTKQSSKRKAPAANPRHGRSLKESKVGLVPPRRLYYVLKGRESYSGEIFYKPYKGYLDFDGTYTSFKGKANSPYISSDAMEGSKTNIRPSTRAEPWGSFSEGAYQNWIIRTNYSHANFLRIRAAIARKRKRESNENP